MQDISKYTPNAQKIIRLGWAAWEAGTRGDEKKFRYILDEREKFCDKNFTLEDYDSMLEESSNYPPEHNMWIRAKERYIAEHQQMTIKNVKKENTKVIAKQVIKTI